MADATEPQTATRERKVVRAYTIEVYADRSVSVPALDLTKLFGPFAKQAGMELTVTPRHGRKGNPADPSVQQVRIVKPGSTTVRGIRLSAETWSDLQTNGVLLQAAKSAGFETVGEWIRSREANSQI